MSSAAGVDARFGRACCFDAHNHLQDERFGGRQDVLIGEARAAGVGSMVVNGSCEADWAAVAELARRHPGFVIPAFGLHPWYLGERTGQWQDRLNRWLDETPGSVVGEIGLDRWILEPPGVGSVAGAVAAVSLEEQVEIFRVQMEIATERNLSASIHCLRAWGRLETELRRGPVPGRGFLLHSYGGPSEMVGTLAGVGARFGFPGYFLHARKARQREAFRTVPRDRLLVETDAPDQRLPSPGEASVFGRHVGEGFELEGPDGKPLNHPANLRVVQGALSEWLGWDAGGMERQLESTFRVLFGGGADPGVSARADG